MTTTSEQHPPISLELLGGFRLLRFDTTISLRTSCQRLVALLALGGRMNREVAADRLWPDVARERACRSLSTALWRVRGADPDVLEIGTQEISLGREVRVDIAAFRLHARLLTRPTTANEESSGAHDLILDAPGELLPGWFDDWVVFERERLRQLRLHALEVLAGRLLSAGLFGHALDAALQAVQLEPLRESAHRLVVEIHLSEGNVVEARRHHGAVEALFRRELGVGLSERMAALLASAR